MIDYCSTFYSNLTPNGSKISFILLSRDIKHDLVISEDYFFVLKSTRQVKEISGFEQIYDYLEKYRYIFDFPEVSFWN